MPTCRTRRAALRCFVLCIFHFSLCTSLSASEPPDRIEVFPPAIHLDSARARAQLVVTGYYGDESRDLTREATYTAEDSALARIDGSVLHPLRDGQTMLIVRCEGRTARVPLVVANFTLPDPVRFKAETLAVLTKQGCNAGSCHGSPEGKNGFHLSLFAYNPRIDEESLIRDGFNRRTNVLDPAESLMLKKPTLKLPHVGGKKLREGEGPYQTLHDWIYEGARPDPPGAPTCTGIKVFPSPRRVLHLPHSTQQLNVTAAFSDGTTRDVTHLATFDTSHKAVATPDESGLVTGHGRGEAAITVRYGDFLESATVTVVEEIPGFAWPDPAPPENNYVDRLVHAKLRQLRYLPSETCDDATFLRRVYLDTIGLPPSPEETRAFLDDSSADKRRARIDRLLDRPEFARFWAQKSADLMRVNPAAMTAERADGFAAWITHHVAANTPFDRFAREILTASGDGKLNPPANYFAAIPTMEDRTEVTAQIFMGSRVQCAKCHNHPFENWTQDDYYRLGAVFARVASKDGVVKLAETGEAKHPATGEVMKPWGAPPDSAEHEAGRDRREAFADWLTKPGNRYFARVEVNRIWSHLLGRGIVEPVDDFRSSNPPANRELLDALAEDFERSGYDRKHIIRTILNSRTYQRSAATNNSNTNEQERFSHASVRLLTAEQLHDAIGRVTGVLLPGEAAVEKRITDADAELKTTRQQLADERPKWEAKQLDTVAAMPRVLGAWHHIGPFPAAKDQEPLATAHPPESALDLDAKYESDKLAWAPQPEWTDGQQVNVPGGVGTVYLYRRVICRNDERATLLIGSDEGVKVFVNGQPIYEHAGKRVFTPDDDRFEAPLHAGVNTILVKLANANGGIAFCFQLLGQGQEFSPGQREDQIAIFRRVFAAAGGMLDAKPVEDPKVITPPILAILATPAGERSKLESATLDERYERTEPHIAQLRDEVERLKGRLDFATQRPYPQPTELLKAFGQPERKTACACERISKPTLTQALQLLNGEEVQAMVARGVKTYAALDDSAAVEELYLAGLARRPTDTERRTAIAHLTRAPSRDAAVEDLLWAVINTREFMFQH